MDSWIEFARGRLFVCALAFMTLGLVRLVTLTGWETWRALHRAGDKSVPWRRILSSSVRWVFPVDKIREQPLFSLTSIVFHVAILIVPLFLAGHVVLWSAKLGVWWPAIPNSVADALTVVALFTSVALIVERAAARPTRALSRFQDYVIPLIVAVPFASGFLLMHPAMNPFAHGPTLLIHILTANLVLFLIPITKLSHATLLPSVQLVSEVAWHWPSDCGSKVAVALGKENELI